MICDLLDQKGVKTNTPSQSKGKKKKGVKSSSAKPAYIPPGDNRANKGTIFLKDEYINRFRQPYH